MTSVLILDTETTDIDGEVIELAYVAAEGLPTRETTFAGKTKRFTPSVPIKFGAMATHHILPEEVVGFAPSSEAPKELPSAEYWIGHNIDFDWKALGSPPKVRRICTLALARAVWPETDSHTLTALHYFLFGATPTTRQILRNAHSAMHDVMLCVQLLHLIVEKMGVSDIEGLYALSEDARIPRKWGFGKFVGKPISAADRGYANWYRSNCKDNPDYLYYCEALRRSGLM